MEGPRYGGFASASINNEHQSLGRKRIYNGITAHNQQASDGQKTDIYGLALDYRSAIGDRDDRHSRKCHYQ